MATPSAVLEMVDVSLVRDGTTILHPLSWRVSPGERWVVLGANGSGKTSLIRIASLYLHPSTGIVRVLGETLGHTDVRLLRRRIGLASSSLREQLRQDLTARDVVMTQKNAALEPWWHQYTDADRARAESLLESIGLHGFADRTIATLSSGEQQRVLLARSLMAEPGLVLLDEPTAGLDLGGREELVGSLAAMADSPETPPVVLVTHHVDEIPPGFTHLLGLRAGRIVAAGTLSDTLTQDSLHTIYGMPLRLEARDGRYVAWVPRR
jgi:iron complex transport system ATP-binding protein